MSFSLMKYINDALALDECALSEIGISIYDSEGKIKNVITIFEEIAELWSKDFEEKIEDACRR